MFRNYIRVTLRNLRKYKAYSFINILGLAVGMACFSLIMLYVTDELSYDTYHENSENTYRLLTDIHLPEGEIHFATSSFPMAEAMKNEFPEIIKTARIQKGNNKLIRYQGNKQYEDHCYGADQSIFDIFEIEFVIGDKETAISQKNTIILTESTAKRYFGNTDPIGKVLILNENDNYQVTGIIKDPPHNTHFQYSFITSLAGRFQESGNTDQDWSQLSNLYTYFVVNKNTDLKEFEEKIRLFPEEYTRTMNENGMRMELMIQHVADIHLNPDFSNEIEPQANGFYVYIFSSIALFILLIACINFMNLSTARSAVRVKEVGLRKVVGAMRKQLILQFLGESVVFTVAAALISFAIVEAFLPAFNALTEKSIDFSSYFSLEYFLYTVLLVLMVGLISGSYPAIYLSSFKPVKVLKGNIQVGGKSVIVRRGLVVLQFAISIILIIGTTIVSRQLNFVKNKDLGLNPEQVMVIPLNEGFETSQFGSFRNELMKNNNILNATISNTTPGTNSAFGLIFKEKGNTTGDQRIILINAIDENYLDTYEIKLTTGRKFSQDFDSDSSKAILVSEKLVSDYGWENPIGKVLVAVSSVDEEFQIVGVFQDTHHFSLEQDTPGMIYGIMPETYSYISVKLNADNINESIKSVEQLWAQFSPNYPMEFTFTDDSFNSKYKTQELFGRIFQYFSILAIFLACLGLFGLSAFAAEQRIKEIGIRKTLGASIVSIAFTFTADFSRWVLAANFVAWPIAYFFMEKYLSDFAFRTSIRFTEFLAAAGIALLIAIITVSYQAVKTALKNPVESLRSE